MDIANIAPLLRAVATLFDIQRPLAVFDIESTGTNPETDRVVSIAAGRIETDLSCTTFAQIVHPQRSIPKEASDVHGITDADVAHAPGFSDIALSVSALLAGADLIGYNHRRFDTRIIAAEVKRCDLPDPCEGARLIDVQTIFHKQEPRDLSAALQFFCGATHEGAHGAAADVIATLRVLLGQFERYQDLPRDLDALDALGRDPSFIDRAGKLIWRGNKACIGFGKHQGVSLDAVDRGYLRWMLDKDFAEDVKAIVRDAIRNKYPTPAAVTELEARTATAHA